MKKIIVLRRKKNELKCFDQCPNFYLDDFKVEKMFENDNHCDDFRLMSLQLFQKQVQIKFRKDTESFDAFGAEIQGRLIGRLWGSKIEKGHSKETVVALTIRTNEKEIFVPCSDIHTLEEAFIDID